VSVVLYWLYTPPKSIAAMPATLSKIARWMIGSIGIWSSAFVTQ